MSTWIIKPGIAAFVLVVDPTGFEQSAIFLSIEKGVVVGIHDRPMKGSAFPDEVQAEINAHFNRVFTLAHEEWKGAGPSPRARYCDALQPWTVECNDEEPA